MSSVRDQLEQVTEQILNKMQKFGWFWGSSSELRFDRPTPRDINNGYCEDWTLLAVETVGGNECWLDTFKTTEDWLHCVLRLNGKYYDSLHLDGCRTLKQFVVEAKIAANQYRNTEQQRLAA